MKTKPAQRPFGVRDKLGYLLGDLGNDFTFLLSSSFLLKFYTDVMGVTPFVVGVVMMVARVTDGFTDIAMGRLCDRGRPTAAGKFKPWLLRMCVPVAAASFLIYQSGLAGRSMPFKIAWLFCTYLLWGSVFYTSINIPYGSMASAISPDPADRQSLSTFRTLGGSLAGLAVGAGIPLIAYVRDRAGNETLSGGRFTLAAGVFSLLTVACYLGCYSLTTERVTFDEIPAAQRPSIGKTLLNALKNRSLLSLIGASVMMLLAQLTMQSMANYIYPNYYGSAAAQSVSTFLMMAGMVLTALAAKPLSQRFGKAEISAAASFLAAISCTALFFLRPANVWVYVGFIFLCWLGLGVFSMVNWALVTDVIDFSELKTGVREDASVYALYSFARKVGQAASAGLTGGLLSLIGYNQETAFDRDVLEGVFNISTLTPAIGFLLLGLVLWFWYPLHKRQVEITTAALQKKREARKTSRKSHRE